MALGGGTFTTQNKILPGTYINFVSTISANAQLSERGIAAIPLTLSWGELGKIVKVEGADFQRNSLTTFGYDYADAALLPIREIFRNAKTLYIYRLGTGGTSAANDYGVAKYVGVRGNDITISIAANETKFDVSTILSGKVLETQTVATSADLVDNDFVVFDKDAELTATAGVPMTGGADPTVVTADYQAFLDAAESYSFNVVGCPSNDTALKALFTSYTKRMREEMGVKFQCVTFDNAADYEGVVNVMNPTTVSDTDYSLIYWVTGCVAGTAVNRSALNKVYDGEYTVKVDYTQSQLEDVIKAGKFAFHRVGSDTRVLSDINSLTTVTQEKNAVFKENQTIRVIDQIANDIAVIFNTRYLGIVPNDPSGRISLWSDIVKHHEQLQDLRAIQNFTSSDVTVSQGDTPKAVVVTDLITVVNAMAQLYMTVTVQ
jgi:hypothetical protein